MTTDAKPAHGGGPAVRYEVADGVATLTLDRPEARNVLGPESLAELRIGLDEAAADDAVRVVVLDRIRLARSAPAPTCAARRRPTPGRSPTPARSPSWRVLERLLDHPKPTIARVQGHVAGGGNGLVAACDLAVAVDSAKFAFSEVRVGVAPAVISVVCLRRMPPREAAALLLTGERVSAQRAHQAGLLTTVAHDHDALDACVADWVGQLLQGGPLALAATKELLRRVPTLDRARGVRLHRPAVRRPVPLGGGARGDDRLRAAPPAGLGPASRRPRLTPAGEIRCPATGSAGGVDVAAPQESATSTTASAGWASSSARKRPPGEGCLGGQRGQPLPQQRAGPGRRQRLPHPRAVDQDGGPVRGGGEQRLGGQPGAAAYPRPPRRTRRRPARPRRRPPDRPAALRTEATHGSRPPGARSGREGPTHTTGHPAGSVERQGSSSTATLSAP